MTEALFFIRAILDCTPMQESKLDTWLIRLLPAVVMVILVLIPFHAILTVCLAQLVGHYTALLLLKEALLIPLGLGSVYFLIKRPSLRKRLLDSKLTWLIAAFIFVQIIWGI